MSGGHPKDDLTYHRALASVLDSLDAAIYVADMQTGELLFLNQYARSRWGESRGRKCWEVLQKDQSGPCPFCTNPRLADDEGNPTSPYVWEFQNTSNGRWYQCRDQAIRWVDGRLVRMEIATDITDRKQMELELEAAKRRAEALAHTDELTHLNNRRAFFELGERALQEAGRLGQPAAVIMFDLDRFKQINDAYGHAAGDKVLKSVARAVRPLIRSSDILGRLGGEEFAVVMTDADLHQALQTAERLRAGIAACRVHHESAVIRPTASFGVAVCNQGRNMLTELLSHADHALLSAKRNGRNRVEHQPEPIFMASETPNVHFR